MQALISTTMCFSCRYWRLTMGTNARADSCKSLLNDTRAWRCRKVLRRKISEQLVFGLRSRKENARNQITSIDAYIFNAAKAALAL